MPAPGRPAKASSSLFVRLVIALFKLIWTAFVVALPLLGVWLGSSLAAYSNGPLWATIVAGLLAFPILPLAWDGYGSFRLRRRGETRPRILTFWDRITLRTLAINLVFLGALLGLNPKIAFTALSTRGDWFLEHARGAWVPKVRAKVFWAADRLEWLYDLTHDNPYKEDTPDPPPKPRPTATAVPALPSSTATPPPSPVPTTSATPPPLPPPDPKAGQDVASRWPFEGAIHPLVAAVPADVATNYEDVARWIAAREPDQVMRIKALHDYVADRVAYDAESLFAGRYPPMDPTIVFDRRAGVCAGYAKLFEAMGRAAGETVLYVTGNSRDQGGDVSGQGHAWNAVLIGDSYHLVDVTWDSGYVEDKQRFVKRYQSDYFLTPPEIFGNNHLPEDPKWQVREHPISRGDFMRQPNLRPSFFAKGLRLIDPTRSQITVADDARMVLENPKGQSILASYEEKGGAKRERCRVTLGPTSEVLCDLKRAGTFHVVLFANDKPQGSHPFVGQIEVNRGP